MTTKKYTMPKYRHYDSKESYYPYKIWDTYLSYTGEICILVRASMYKIFLRLEIILRKFEIDDMAQVMSYYLDTSKSVKDAVKNCILEYFPSDKNGKALQRRVNFVLGR